MLLLLKELLKQKKLNIDLENCITATVKKKSFDDKKLKLGGCNFCFLIDKETYKVLFFYRDK